MHAVEGKLSEYYNHFEDLILDTCEATETRLMGVVAMRIKWKYKNNPLAFYYQILHLDYSEYGIDDYFEFDCTPNATTYQENKEAMKYHWSAFTSVMGGKIIHVSAPIMLKLIEDALPLAASNIEREYDNKENEQFRHNAMIRLDLMIKTLAEDGINSAECTSEQAIDAVSKRNLTVTETINYFIMRLVDLDYPAAMHLSSMSRDELEECELVNYGMQTLMRNQIKHGNAENAKENPEENKEENFVGEDAHPFRCWTTTLGKTRYYHAGLVVYLDGGPKARDSKVTSIAVGSIDGLTSVEAAMQLARDEYITVFDCQDRLLSGFDSEQFAFLADVNPQQVPNGWLYVKYNSDNSHVNSSDYRLNNDVYGCALLSIDGEFILMSNKLENIEAMDTATLFSTYSPFMRLEGRYQFDTPLFHSLCNSYGVLFKDFLENSENGD